MAYLEVRVAVEISKYGALRDAGEHKDTHTQHVSGGTRVQRARNHPAVPSAFKPTSSFVACLLACQLVFQQDGSVCLAAQGTERVSVSRGGDASAQHARTYKLPGNRLCVS